MIAIYLPLTEAAQIDYLARTGLIVTLMRGRYGFVNAAVLIRFAAPIRLFSWLTIESRVIFRDNRFAYLEHRFTSHGVRCASVLVKMTFKHGRQIIVPAALLGSAGNASKPDYLQA